MAPGHSDCQGFWNLHGLQVGYRWVWVWVQKSVPTTYKKSSRTSKMDKNWQRYGQNSRKYCLAHISVISGPFWLFLGSKTHRVAGKDPWGKGIGWKKKTQGLPMTITAWSHSSPSPYPYLNTTMRFMTRRCWWLSEPSKSGNTLSKGPNTSSRFGPITRTWSTSCWPNTQPEASLVVTLLSIVWLPSTPQAGQVNG